MRLICPSRMRCYLQPDVITVTASSVHDGKFRLLTGGLGFACVGVLI